MIDVKQIEDAKQPTWQQYLSDEALDNALVEAETEAQQER
jgi:hypothetical protein